jgi:hypothetical protein
MVEVSDLVGADSSKDLAVFGKAIVQVGPVSGGLDSLVETCNSRFIDPSSMC